MEAAESAKVRILGTKERILAAMYYAATGRTQVNLWAQFIPPNLITHPPRCVVLVPNKHIDNLDDIVKKLGGSLILHIYKQFLFLLQTFLHCQTYNEWVKMNVCNYATHVYNELHLLTLQECFRKADQCQT